jgi:hypothetical protein
MNQKKERIGIGAKIKLPDIEDYYDIYGIFGI